MTTLGNGAGEGVVGVFARERLSDGLVATHRGGFGAHVRVLDPARGELAGQLRRAGFPNPISPDDLGTTAALILVTAPGRAAVVGRLLTEAGARAVHVVNRAPPPLEDTTRPGTLELPPLDLAVGAGDELGA